ncbi:hypothetical protein PMAYCL1PPCAC_17303, partial [Pristionchus mayeri]
LTSSFLLLFLCRHFLLSSERTIFHPLRKYSVMEDQKVTPQYIAAEVKKAIAFYKEFDIFHFISRHLLSRTVAITTKFYEEQIDRIIEFHKNQCDRYFQHNVPMLNNQIDAMERAFGGEFSAWNDTVFRLSFVLNTSLANLAALSTETLAEEKHPSAQFVSKTTVGVDKFLNKFQEEMLDKREEASRYREKEREEIQDRFRELSENREKIEAEGNERSTDEDDEHY